MWLRNQTPAEILPDEPLRNQFDIDFMDFLSLIIALHQELFVEIPEVDYRQLATLNGMVDHLSGAMARPEGLTRKRQDPPAGSRWVLMNTLEASRLRRDRRSWRWTRG